MSPPFLYKQVSYVALCVSDLAQSKQFYTSIVGLELTREIEGECAALRCDQHVASVVLYQGAVAGLRRIAFQLASLAELEKARAHFQAKGYALWEVPLLEREFLRTGESFRVLEPSTGVTFEYFAHIEECATPYQPGVANILRLGHVVVRTTDIEGCWETLGRDFGLLTSDFVPDKAVWARCYPNVLHHSLALVKSQQAGLHHVNFMVSEIDDIGRARNHLINQNIEIVFGPGRHKPSGSVFLYFLDPDGMTAEFSFGMEEFSPEGAREPRMLENSSTTMDLWGGHPRPEFSSTGEILTEGL